MGGDRRQPEKMGRDRRKQERIGADGGTGKDIMGQEGTELVLRQWRVWFRDCELTSGVHLG